MAESTPTQNQMDQTPTQDRELICERMVGTSSFLIINVDTQGIDGVLRESSVQDTDIRNSSISVNDDLSRPKETPTRSTSTSICSTKRKSSS